MFFHGKKSKSQTHGFSNYAPQKCDLKFLYLRWSVKAFNTIAPSDKRGRWILAQIPWVRLFAERTKVFYFHRASELSPEIMAGLKQFVEFMEEHAQAWWDLLHWITICLGADKTSRELHHQRRTRTDSLIHKHQTEFKRLRATPGFKESLLEEPGIWPLPQRVCHWIWEDPRTKPKSLHKQLEALDEREPERTMWASATNEVARTQHVSSQVRKQLIPLPERARNWIVPDSEDNE